MTCAPGVSIKLEVETRTVYVMTYYLNRLLKLIPSPYNRGAGHCTTRGAKMTLADRLAPIKMSKSRSFLA
jgi:hypothetical protein